MQIVFLGDNLHETLNTFFLEKRYVKSYFLAKIRKIPIRRLLNLMPIACLVLITEGKGHTVTQHYHKLRIFSSEAFLSCKTSKITDLESDRTAHIRLFAYGKLLSFR